MIQIVGWPLLGLAALVRLGRSRGSWLLELIDTWLLYLLAPWPALGLVAARARSAGLAALAGLGSLLALARVWPAIARARRPGPSGGPRVRVLTANVLAENTCVGGLVELIERERPDIVALQELRPAFGARLIERVGRCLPYHEVRPGRRFAGAALLSRWPLEAVETFHLAGIGHLCQRARVVLDGRRVEVFNIHLQARAEIYPRHGGLLPFGIRPHAGTLRDEQIDLLIGLVAGLDEPAIVVGDFNAAAGSRPHRQLLGHLRDAYREAGRGFGHTFPQPVSIHGLTLPAPLLRIDYVFFKGPLEPLTARTICQPGSDHRAVLVDFGFSCRVRETASGRARKEDRAGLVRRLRLEGAVESVLGLSRTSPEGENGGLPMTETRPPDAGAQRGYHALAEAERLLMQAEQDPAAARPAAVEALRALLFQWAQTPRGERVSELLAQAAETDPTLADFRLAAADLDAHSAEADAYERAKMFVDAARGRLANI